jgi:hypothetical protein
VNARLHLIACALGTQICILREDQPRSQRDAVPGLLLEDWFGSPFVDAEQDVLAVYISGQHCISMTRFRPARTASIQLQGFSVGQVIWWLREMRTAGKKYVWEPLPEINLSSPFQAVSTPDVVVFSKALLRKARTFAECMAAVALVDERKSGTIALDSDAYGKCSAQLLTYMLVVMKHCPTRTHVFGLLESPTDLRFFCLQRMSGSAIRERYPDVMNDTILRPLMMIPRHRGGAEYLHEFQEVLHHEVRISGHVRICVKTIKGLLNYNRCLSVLSVSKTRKMLLFALDAASSLASSA